MATQKKQKKAAKKTAKTRTAKRAPRAAGDDIVQLILADHKPIKELIKTLKDSEAGFSKRQAAFEKFGALLTAHAKSEEQALYVDMKEDKEMRTEGFEGDVEHMLADQLLQEAQATNDEDLWSAQVKVLAELVEHHLEEEEKEMLPDYRKHSSEEERSALGQKYLHLKAKYDNWSGEGVRNPRGTEIRPQH